MSESSLDHTADQIQRLQDRLRVISDVTRGFAEATTDYERLLDTVARSLTEVIKDSCVVFLLEEYGTSVSPVSIHADQPDALLQVRSMFAAGPLQLHEQPAMRRLLETGEALLVPRLDHSLPRTDTTPEQVQAQVKLGLHSYLVVALRLHGRSIGALALGRFRAESPAYTEHDRNLAQNLADHASLAIANARLYSAEKAARRAAEEAEETLRKSEEAHRLFFESSPIATFVFDAGNLRLLAANAPALRLYGYSKAEFLELGLGDLRVPEDDSDLMATLRAMGDADGAGHARHRRKDGTLIHVEGKTHLASFEGRPARFAVVSDVTKRWQAEAALLESERLLQRTLDDMMEGYFIMGHDLRYLYVNETGARQSGLLKQELLGRTPMEVFPDFQKTRMHAVFSDCLAQRSAAHVEEELKHIDGRTGYFELNVRPTPEGIIIRSIDVSERRRAAKERESLEEQLRQSQKMDAVGRLAGGVAHDFNNVLSVILGYGESMLADLKHDDPLRADVFEIQKAGMRAAELTKQLLMFSRQQVLEPKVLNLNEVVRSMEVMLRRVLGEQLDLLVVLSPSLGRIRADRSNIEQVVMNLVVNARDAMPQGGKLTLETGNVDLDDAFAQSHLGTEPGPYVLLAVSDTGVGMEAATQGRIFEPFFSTKGHGTGLGLSTVFGIVQQSGGGIWVYSEPGKGSTFKVYLPRAEGELDVRTPSAAPSNLRGSETILLVEDEESVRVVARRILERNGYHVVVPEDASQALLLCEQQPERIDLLLTDVVMPRVSGTELAARLVARWPEVKVLFMSGYTDGSVFAHDMLESGASFLQKPFTAELLAQKVRSVLDGEAQSFAPLSL